MLGKTTTESGRTDAYAYAEEGSVESAAKNARGCTTNAPPNRNICGHALARARARVCVCVRVCVPELHTLALCVLHTLALCVFHTLSQTANSTRRTFP